MDLVRCLLRHCSHGNFSLLFLWRERLTLIFCISSLNSLASRRVRPSRTVNVSGLCRGMASTRPDLTSTAMTLRWLTVTPLTLASRPPNVHRNDNYTNTSSSFIIIIIIIITIHSVISSSSSSSSRTLGQRRSVAPTSIAWDVTLNCQGRRLYIPSIDLGSDCISMFSVNLIFDKTLMTQFCFSLSEKSPLFGL